MNPMQMMGQMMGGVPGGSNPLMMLMNAMHNGGNPMTLMQQMAGQNPQVAQAMRLIQGKNSRQLRQTAENMAKDRGVDLDQMARQMGITLPK